MPHRLAAELERLGVKAVTDRMTARCADPAAYWLSAVPTAARQNRDKAGASPATTAILQQVNGEEAQGSAINGWTDV